ncbi:uncharacterized protein [Physcomitrium patens]|uniref:uncharacterized protein n=1 Tax=Physcomitrium patens TaxID=3218 RepID=UPI003CCCCF98
MLLFLTQIYSSPLHLTQPLPQLVRDFWPLSAQAVLFDLLLSLQQPPRPSLSPRPHTSRCLSYNTHAKPLFVSNRERLSTLHRSWLGRVPEGRARDSLAIDEHEIEVMTTKKSKHWG